MSFALGPLDAGTHYVSRFKPEMELTVPEGWSVTQDHVDRWSMARDDTNGELVGARVRVGLMGPCDTDEQRIIGSGVDDLIAWVSGREDLEVSGPEAVNLGGYPGIEVEATPREALACAAADDPTWSLFQTDEAIDRLSPGDRVTVTALDVDGTTVAFLTVAGDGTSQFEDLASVVKESFAFPTS